MNLVLTVVLALQMLSAVGMIGLILIQHGKGADMGAAFGSGSSGSLFGASGSANFMSRTTAVLATVFFVSTLALAYFGNLRPTSAGGSVLERAPATAPAPLPAPTGAPAQIPGNSAPRPVPQCHQWLSHLHPVQRLIPVQIGAKCFA
jgi:preprotein translocase subunit SecG